MTTSTALRADRKPRPPQTHDTGPSRSWRLPDDDPCVGTFRLAHLPGAPLLGVQRAAMKDHLRRLWAVCDDPAVGILWGFPGVPDYEVERVGAEIATELGVHHQVVDGPVPMVRLHDGVNPSPPRRS